MSSPSVFLSAEDVATLTGRKVRAKQIETLRSMGVPFYVNAVGCPVVPAAAVEGRKAPAPKPKSNWRTS
ncbi:DUF4224 domain-containing protein [Janthinobacterium sp. CG_S6]|uniref:DUF4224 domain-containing protein n=1 Tax=unclassified Janthinobacterium TaxID=2610881 RepID=UPI00036F0F30|nr:hypothetical protein [Janthinobacterium sp. CG_S6]